VAALYARVGALWQDYAPLTKVVSSGQLRYHKLRDITDQDYATLRYEDVAVSTE
jgi:hypothetical protein